MTCCSRRHRKPACRSFRINLHGFETTFATHLLAHPFSLIANLVSMMETGFPVRFPNLKIAFTEGGIAWFPSIMWSMDKEYAERQRQGPYLTDQSSAYFKPVFLPRSLWRSRKI